MSGRGRRYRSDHAHRRFVPFGVKLILTYLLLVAVPVITIGTFAYLISLHSATQRTQTSIDATMRQIHDNIELKVAEIKRVSDQLYFDMPLQRIFRNRYDNVFDVYDTFEKIVKPSFNNALKLSGSSLMVTIYSENESIAELNAGVLEAPLANAFSSVYALTYMSRVRGSWYSEDDFASAYDLVWMQADNDAKHGNISLLRKMKDIEQGFNDIGLIRVTVRQKDIFGPLDNGQLGAGARLLIADTEGNVVYGNRAGVSREEILAGSKRYIRKSLPLVTMQSELVALIPVEELHRDARNVRNLTVLVCLTSFVLLFAIGLLFSGYFARRVGKIRSALDAFRDGEFHKRIRFPGNDEFADIAQSFNHMATTVDELIHEVYVTKLRKKESELDALQAQINPHFLYNTLSSVSQLAKMGENDKLQEMILGLARYYRLTLNNGKTMISVKDEVDQARAYLEIQQIKYGDRIKVLWDIGPDLYEYRTVKLILQPFLENVLKHAWFGDMIHIRLTAECEGNELTFRIIDNGIGMDRETLERIASRTEEGRGYGIRNVDERIRLQYGDAYGIRIASRRGMGTGVMIRIPARRE